MQWSVSQRLEDEHSASSNVNPTFTVAAGASGYAATVRCTAWCGLGATFSESGEPWGPESSASGPGFSVISAAESTQPMDGNGELIPAVRGGTILKAFPVCAEESLTR